MKRQLGSSRTNKWLKRNSLNQDTCCSYVVSLCENHFKFDKFKIDMFNNISKALWITYGLYSYVIFVDEKEINLLVLENLIIDNNNKYREVKRFNGDACWYNCFTWIINR